MAKRVPKHLRCQRCRGYCDLRTAGTVEIDGRRYHVRCILPKPSTQPGSRRLSPEAAAAIFGGTTTFWEGIQHFGAN